MKIDIKKILVMIVMILLLTPIVRAYETENYSIDMPDSYEKEDADGVTAFVNESKKSFIGIVELSAEGLSDETFYTEEVMNQMSQTANEYFDSTIIPAIEQDPVLNPNGLRYFLPSGENNRITKFTKNNYDCIEISRGIVLNDAGNTNGTGESAMFGLRYIYTLQNGKLYGVVSFYEVSDNAEEDFNAINSIINTLTFKSPEQPEETKTVVEEPKVEEMKKTVQDDTKAEGKLPHTGYPISITGAMLSLLVLFTVLLVLKNKKESNI